MKPLEQKFQCNDDEEDQHPRIIEPLYMDKLISSIVEEKNALAFKEEIKVEIPDEILDEYGM